MFNRSTLLAASLLMATFILGIAVGGGTVAAWGDNPDRPSRPPRERVSFAARLQQDLDLTAVQRESVEVIMNRRQDSMRQMWGEISPRFDSLRRQINRDIMAVLDSSQQATFEDLIARADSARRHRDRRGEHERK
ncbi:MAG: hypothetical protein OER90_03245 [Gemmatimonadota bacterium]|nr:hypothetical protein [Gemmatimonadota bacterium]